MGILFLSVTMNGSEFKELSFAAITKVATNANPLYLKIAFIFVFVGFSTKMELFPMHTVGIDANSVAPSPIGGIISTGLVNLGFIAIFRVYTALSHTSILSWMNNVFILSGVLSILVAAGYMLKAKHNKRIFAYSSLENMGLVAIGIGVGGAGYYAVILLLILHAFTKSSLFFQLGQVYRVLKTMRLDDSGQYMKLHPVGAMVLIIGLISIMAIPPSGLFVSEFMIFKALVADNRWFVLIITVVLLASVLYAMTTRIMHINFSMPRQTIDVTTIKISPIESLSQYIFLGIVIFLCFYQPPFLVDLINQSIASLPK